MSKAWEKIEGETNAQWTAFQAWLNSDLPRNIDKAYRIQNHHGNNTSKRAQKYYRNWYHKNNWQDRSDAYDAWKQAEKDKAEIKAAADAHKDMIKRHISLFQRAQYVVASILEKTEADKLDSDEARELLKYALNLVTDGVAGERIALGEPSQIIEERRESNVSVSAVITTKREISELDTEIAAELEAITPRIDEEKDSIPIQGVKEDS